MCNFFFFALLLFLHWTVFLNSNNRLDEEEIVSNVSAISHSSIGTSTNISSRVESTSRGYYEGERLNGLRHGYGVYTSQSGSVYKGHWWHDLKHGRFDCFLSNGDTYVGKL